MSVQRRDGYAPLKDYGFLADGHAQALVAADGSVDWLGAPRAAGPPVCAAILDPAAGGSITLEPTVPHQSEQRYVEGTLVLETTFRCADSVVRVRDALNRSPSGPLPWTELARRVEVEGKPVPMRWRVALGHRLRRQAPWAEDSDGTAFVNAGTVQACVVTDRAGQPQVGPEAVTGEFTARSGESSLVALIACQGAPLRIPKPDSVLRRLDHTVAFWRDWCSEIDYDGPHAADVRTSALVLKGLTSASSGGLMAASTTSLPERVGGGRNFDYRFGWVRDASFALDAMQRLDLTEAVQSSLAWLLRSVRRTAPQVRAMYTVSGEPASPEMSSLDWLPGYRSSPPVHVGNSAADQVQLGGYGDLMDAVWRYCNGSARLDEDNAHALSEVIDHVCDSWREEDSGIWELQEHAHYTISKIGCWVALDRGIRLCEGGQMATLHLNRWKKEREAVHAWVDEHCWSEVKQSYTFYAGTDELDASVMLAGRTDFLEPDDPRLASTVAAIRTELGAGGPLLYRYSGMDKQEGAFLVCTFWLIEALAILGRKEEGEDLLTQVLDLAGDTRLFSEEIDPESHAYLGNLPQALSHLGVIGAATALYSTDPSSPD